MWNLESFGVLDKTEFTQKEVDKRVLENFNVELKFDDSRYSTGLTGKTDQRPVSNLELAKVRIGSLLKRLVSDKDLLDSYDNYITELESEGIIEKIFCSDKRK